MNKRIASADGAIMMLEFKTPFEGAEFFLTTNRPIFPLARGAKVPPRGSEGLRESSTTDRARVEAWSDQYRDCNWGYCPAKGGETVIDLDNHAGKDGIKTMKDWAESLGQKLPRTFAVRTPSGGYHLYYRGTVPVSKDGFLPGVDVHCAKAHVAVPGSRTEKGQYQVEYDGTVAELPQWFIDEFKRRCKAWEPKKGTAEVVNIRIDPDTPEKIDAATEIIQSWPEQSEGTRNHNLYMLASELCKAGITEKTAWELYVEYGMERLHYGEGDEEKEALKTMQSAYREKAQEFGVSTTQNLLGMFGPAKYKMEDWRTIAAMEVPDRKWLIRDWLLAEPGTVHLFSGQGGTGKSLVALTLVYSLATGMDFLGMKPERRAKSVIVSCEDPMPEQARRLQRIEKSFGRPVEEGLVKIWCRTGENNVLAVVNKEGFVRPTEFLRELKTVCAEHFRQDGGVLILDTLSDFVAINENDRMQVSQFVKHILTGLASELGVTIFLLGHPNKTNSGFSGSTAWEGAVRSRWELEWEKANGETKVGSSLVLRLAKSNATMAGKEILLQYGEDHIPHVVEKTERDTELEDVIVSMIDTAEEEGNPFGRGKRSRRPIASAEIVDPTTGVKLEPKEIDDLIGTLLAEGRVFLPHTKSGNVLTTHKK